MLTGDAAELLDPFLGQGIALAIGLAPHAADAARRLVREKPSPAAASQYEAARAAAVQPVRMHARAVNALLRVRWLRQRAARRIARKPELADQLLAAIADVAPGGGFPARLMWGLLA